MVRGSEESSLRTIHIAAGPGRPPEQYDLYILSVGAKNYAIELPANAPCSSATAAVLNQTILSSLNDGNETPSLQPERSQIRFRLAAAMQGITRRMTEVAQMGLIQYLPIST